uniref:uncharacterized protein LOC105352073 n=1 Tax=Fragaria vesca subsp. vesca TaxID=101020 RepID=UPI0005C89694|nr:PREDICTED: uncharacterized protein LOC105352073 [Fragaria vesca subsp. vesca]
MASRLLTRTLRSLAPISSFLNKHPTHPHLPISASSSSSLIFHKRTSSSPTFLTSTPIRLFTSQPDHNEHKPKIVTLTSIIHELADAGQTKESLDIYKRFKAAGIFPPYTTFISLIKALAADPEFVEEAKECVVDMMTNHLCNHPSVSAFMAVYKGFVKQDKAKEGRRFLKEIKAKGLGRVDEEDVREALRGRPEAEVKRVIQILMDDKYGESTRPLESLYNNFAAVDAHFKKYTHQELSSNEYFLQNMKIASVFMMGCEAESMFVGLIQDGLTEEAMKIRSSILETGKIPAIRGGKRAVKHGHGTFKNGPARLKPVILMGRAGLRKMSP